LLDDSKARKYARSSNVRVIGTLGIIYALYRKKKIKKEPNEIYQELRSVDFWITKGLFSKLFP